MGISNGAHKPFPLKFVVLASVLLILPARWLAPIELFILSFTRPFVPAIAAAAPEDSPEARIKALEAENLILRAENKELRRKLLSIDKLAETQPSALRTQESYEIIVAGVIISEDSSAWRRSIFINRGEKDGITPGLVVVSGKYLIGKISESELGAFTSRVDLITDPHFHIKAWCVAPPVKPSAADKKSLEDKPAGTGARETIEPVPDSGLGVLEGWSTDQCRMKWVARDIPVKPDWQVFSATDSEGIYPRGLIIGRVTSVTEESCFWRLTVEPAINPHSLTSLLILKPRSALK